MKRLQNDQIGRTVETRINKNFKDHRAKQQKRAVHEAQSHIKDALLDGNSNTSTAEQQTLKPEWMTAEILVLMNVRRLFKGKN